MKLLIIFILIFICKSSSFKEEILKISKELQDKNEIKKLQEWIQQKSLSTNESFIQILIEKELKEMGLIVDVYEPNLNELKKYPNFLTIRKDFKNSNNVIGILKGSQGIEINLNGDIKNRDYYNVILNGHIDVVSEGQSPWEIAEPYSGKIINNKLYGRGTSDMKGGLFSQLLAIKMIQKLNIKLKGDIIFESVIEEESGSAGTISTIQRGYKGDLVIITEPSEMKIFPKQQGSCWFKIHIFGKLAHGGTRYEGISAIEKSFKIIKKIKEIEKKRNERFKKEKIYSNLKIPIPINIGIIQGGKWPSMVSDYVELQGRLGISPFETIEMAKNEFEKELLFLNQNHSHFKQYPIQIEYFGAQWEPGSIDINHDAMNYLIESFQLFTNKDPIIQGSPWGTDGGVFTRNNIPSLVFGPGITKVAHQKDEYIEIDKIFKCAEILALTLINLCKIQ